MKNAFLFNGLAITMIVITISCRQTTKTTSELNLDLQGSINRTNIETFDSLAIDSFFAQFPNLQQYYQNVKLIYQKHQYHYIWSDTTGIIEFAQSLYGKIKSIASEGVYSSFPYIDKAEGIFEASTENTLSPTQTELMITNMFLFYSENVYKGLDDKTVAATEWLLPKKQVSYRNMLDSVLLNPYFLEKPDSELFDQYFKLRNMLKKYREIQKKGGWKAIEWNAKVKSYKIGDTAQVIASVKERLVISEDLAVPDSSNLFNEALGEAIQQYQLRTGKNPKPVITKSLVDEMNIPVEERIKKIVVNMERCRWISPELLKAKEFIFVNIPSYMLYFSRNGEMVFESPVVVGKEMSKTVIFSANMSSIVFSPYWNVPNSIVEKEVKPGIKKDPNYLAKHNMEWVNGQVRQKPGKKNSLGLVKFLFPNINNIYLHDTPSKSHFAREERAFSHGCIRVAKPRDLAVKIMENDTTWTPQKIDAAMNAGVEKWYSLKEKIPVYIGYFTAWVDDNGKVFFYDDVYRRDDSLFDIIIGNNQLAVEETTAE